MECGGWEHDIHKIPGLISYLMMKKTPLSGFPGTMNGFQRLLRIKERECLVENNQFCAFIEMHGLVGRLRFNGRKVE